MGNNASVSHSNPYRNAQSPMTTGQAAKECRVADRTLAKWMDSGKLKGYYLPGSRERRFLKSDLLEFMRQHKIPPSRELVDCVEGGTDIVYGLDTSYEPGTDVLVFDDPFELGYRVATLNPKRVVICDCDGIVMMARAVRFFKFRFPRAEIVLVIGDDVTVDKLEALGLGNEKRSSYANRVLPTIPFLTIAQ